MGYISKVYSLRISSSLNARHLVFLRSNVSKSKSKQRLRSKCNVDDSNLANADVRLRVTSRETLWVHSPSCFLGFFSIFCPFFKYLYPASQKLLKEESHQFWMINVPYLKNNINIVFGGNRVVIGLHPFTTAMAG